MRPLEAGHGGAQPASSGRRYIGCEDHMQDVGTSAPFYGRHGQGRRPGAEDQLHGDFSSPPPPHQGLWGQSGPLPRGPNPRQFAQTSVHGPAPARDEAAAEASLPKPADMKSSMEEWLSDVFGVVIADKRKWDQVVVEEHGSYWACHALNLQGISLAREGPSARALAEKLSTMPLAELRHFGLRFNAAGSQEMQGKNRSLQSPGVHMAFGSKATPDGAAYGIDGGVSCTRRDPEEMGRRYIASGQDHFNGLCQSGVDAQHGGRRFIGTRDHLAGGGALKDGEAAKAQLPVRRAGYTNGQSSGPLW
eukprot:gb/GFBE01048313.1/.p1 GENE.gb/GFBE01048313.1/~~gb/GFBE01048313.1/.p1  ORF type:complete len:305 (+),score=45.52 gb/GFBE01048313.1/:1-915(+)